MIDFCMPYAFQMAPLQAQTASTNARAKIHKS